ncbi:hypothetical protein QR680_012409 [Steinernema hermaphroditum]|uniref:Rho-GAP domain-containing protein n=1 Tax=Steinernema hermaphroditum TaxID=289476 RepID=A0AA39LZT6_9BILA|nr:hypothetical protein QR680_012409 [Steinernema hermaphroditum]
MSVRPILLFRQSKAQNYGFTIEHVATYPPPSPASSFVSDGGPTPTAIQGPPTPPQSPIHTILISRVEPDGVAAKSGIHVGDRLVEIEGVPVLNLSHVQAQGMVHNSGHRLSLMIVSSRRTPSRPPSSENGKGPCRRLFCDDSAEGRSVMMPQAHPLDPSPLRPLRHNGHDLIYDDTDSSSIPTVPSLSSVNSSGSNGYMNGNGTDFYEAMLREKRRELNTSPRVSYNFPNQESRIRALFDEMRPKIEESRLCGFTAASMTSFSSSPSPPQESHRYDLVKPRIKLAEPDSWMRYNQQSHSIESTWKRAPFVQNQRNKRHGAGDWSGQFEAFQEEDQQLPPKPFDYRNSKRQASFMAAVNNRSSLDKNDENQEQVKASLPTSHVLTPSSVILSDYAATGKPPIPASSAAAKLSLRSRKSNQRLNEVDESSTTALPRRRPRNDPRRKTIHDFAQALEAEQQEQYKEGRMLDSGVVSDGESSTAKPRVPSATSTAVNSSPSHNLQPTARTIRQRPVSYMMATGSPTRTGFGGFDTGLVAPLSASQSSIPTASKATHHRRALASFTQSSLSPADAATKPATSAASSPSAHGSKINKFIAFFSSHEPSQHKSLDLSTASERREVLKRAATTGTSTTSATGSSSQGQQKLIRPVRQRDVQHQGQVFHKEVCLGESSKRTAARRWDQCFAVLHCHRLYLCKQLSSTQATDDDPLNKILNIPADAKVLDVKAAIVDIAYELLQSEQRHNVVRILTQQQQHVEHFLQTESEASMLTWIEKIRSPADSVDTVEECSEDSQHPHPVVSTTSSADSESSLPSNRAGSAGSHTGGPRSSTCENVVGASGSGPAATLDSATASSAHGGANSVSAVSGVNNSEVTSQLIMHRYKAKTNQLGSPHASKKSVDESLDGLLGGPSTSTDGNPLYSSFGDNITPKSGRRWKKSKAVKQGSGSSGRSDKASSMSDKQASAVFGKKLSECALSGDEGDLVPLLVQVCVRVVETHGMETVGIYRIPGNTAAVNGLKEALAQGFPVVDYTTDARWRDVNVVSSLLKMFLRNLPEPLLTDKLYPFFIDANRIASHHNRLHKIRNLLRKLPDEHYATLKYLMEHFRSVVSHSAVNKMEVRNMALMFGPSIVRPSDDTMATLVTHMSDQCRLIETFINYFEWMFDDNGTAEQPVPEQVAGDQQSNPGSGVVSQLNGSGSGGALQVDTGPMTVASFNDMHNLLRKVNEQEAAAMMNENKSNKITKILNVRRNSRKDKSKNKKTATSSTSSIGQDPPSTSPATKQSRSQTASVDSAFCGHYQERDIDAEIACRQQTVAMAGAPPLTSASSPATTSRPMTSSSLDKSPSVGSSLGSYEQQSQSSLLEQPVSTDVSEMRRRRLQNLYSARRIFIAGTDAEDDGATHHADPDDLASHSRHLNAAGTPALDVLSQESREKIQRIQKLQSWSKTASSGGTSIQMDSATSASVPHITKGMSELTVDDAVSLTSDYSTTSSAAPMHVPMSVSCHMDQLVAASSDYASSDVSPAPRGDIVSFTGSSNSIRPTSPEDVPTPSATSKQRSPSPVAVAPAGRLGQKLRFRNNRGHKDPLRRHTLSDMDTVREALAKDRAARYAVAQTSAATTDSVPSPRVNHNATSKVGKFARWIKNSFRKSSPDLRIKPTTEPTEFVFLSGSPRSCRNLPPLPLPSLESAEHPENRNLHELTPISTDEQL